MGDGTGRGNRAAAFLRAACAGRLKDAEAELTGDGGGDGLYAACALGGFEAVDAAIGADPSFTARAGGPLEAEPLIYACFSPFHREDGTRAEGILGVARLLLERGANPNATLFVQQHNLKLPALYGACGAANHPAMAELLLEAGAEINDNESLYHSVEHLDNECLGLLLRRRARVTGTNALFHCLDYENIEGLRLLLDHGADMTERLGEDETPLHWAVKRGRSVEILGLMLGRGAEANARDGQGRTPYALAMRLGNREAADLLKRRGAADELSARERFAAACAAGDGGGAKRMAEAHPGIVDELSPEEQRALPDAAERGNMDAVRIMLGLGFDPAARGTHGGTALHWAAWRGDAEMARLLIERNAPLELRCHDFQCTPLAWAAHGSDNSHRADGDYLETARALVDAGAVIDLRNNAGEWLIPMSHQPLADFLRSRVETK